MKATEAAALLAIAAAYDNRKPDPDAATAWAMALHDLRFEDCREAVVEHYRRSREWMMPSDVLEGVTRIRNERLNRFWKVLGQQHLSPPRELADDPRAENRWVGEMTKRIRDGVITHPDQLDEAPTGELVERDIVAELGTVGREMPRA